MRPDGVRDLLWSAACTVGPDTDKKHQTDSRRWQASQQLSFDANDDTVDRYIPRQDEEEAHEATRRVSGCFRESIRQ